MAKLTGGKLNLGTTAPESSAMPNTVGRSSRFKYYIHDGIDACRLQLIGELTAADVPELSGCWRTVKTTLDKRKLILDLRDLKGIDEAGREWVTSLVEQGSECIPRSLPTAPFPQTAPHRPIALDSAPQANIKRPERSSKLLALLRTLRLIPAEPSTPAQ